MPRRRRTDAADALIDLTARLPWWAGVALAAVSWFVLHRLALQAPAAATPLVPGQIGGHVARSMGAAVANVAQYILPPLFLIGAGISAWRRRERRQLVERAVASPAADALGDMTWQQFERLVGESFARQGYAVAETGTGGVGSGGRGDGGVDLMLRRGGETFLVQCKQWRAFKVGVAVVRELYGAMAARSAAGGFVVTSGAFTDEARAFADGRNVTLVDGPRLHAMLRQARAPAPSASSSRPAPPASSVPSAPPAPSTSRFTPVQAPATTQTAAANPAGPAHGAPTPPLCPVCTSPMVSRTAKKGPAAGRSFWGCRRYPSCRGTRPIEGA